MRPSFPLIAVLAALTRDRGLGRLFSTSAREDRGVQNTVRDAWNRPVLLFKNEWNLNQLKEDHPDFELSNVAPVVSGVEPISL